MYLTASTYKLAEDLAVVYQHQATKLCMVVTFGNRMKDAAIIRPRHETTSQPDLSSRLMLLAQEGVKGMGELKELRFRRGNW